jgi:hypothetical protein
MVPFPHLEEVAAMSSASREAVLVRADAHGGNIRQRLLQRSENERAEQQREERSRELSAYNKQIAWEKASLESPNQKKEERNRKVQAIIHR